MFVLGPERPDPILPAVLDRLEVRGPVALVSAGWRYDEDRDEPLRAAIGRTVHNLRIYDAFSDIEREAPELASAHARKQSMLKAEKVKYRVLVANAVASLRQLWEDRDGPFFAEALAHLRAADERFLATADALHATFVAEMRPDRHPMVRAVRARTADVLAGCHVVLIAGGHVGVLRNRLTFFGLGDLLGDTTVVAWSAGAMALTDRVVLFHDHAEHGVGGAELLDRGLGLVPGVVLLPHARQRLALEDPLAVGILARRFGPALGLQNGAHLVGGENVGRAGTAFWLQGDGTLADLRGVDAARP